MVEGVGTTCSFSRTRSTRRLVSGGDPLSLHHFLKKVHLRQDGTRDSDQRVVYRPYPRLRHPGEPCQSSGVDDPHCGRDGECLGVDTGEDVCEEMVGRTQVPLVLFPSRSWDWRTRVSRVRTSGVRPHPPPLSACPSC